MAAKILKYVSDINMISGGSTLFIKAAEFGLMSVIELMIIERPELDINFQLRGCSALWIAVFNGHSPVVQELLCHPHIQVDHPGRAGLTLFAASVMQGHLEVSRMLWNTGKVDVNHEARNGQTPLLLALECCDKALVHYLLGRPGISLEYLDELRNTPINNAVCYNLIPVVRLLLDMAPRLADTVDNQRRTPLLIAVESGRRDTVRLLLDAGASPNLANNKGQTPLSSTLFHGKLMVQLLLSYGADINEIDSSEQGLLHKAVRYNCAEVIPILLEFGADPNVRDARDCTALGTVIDDGYYSVIQYLISDRHVDLNTLSGGYPHLTIAIMNNQITTVRLLCAVSKLDPNQLDRDSQTPLNTAIMYHCMNIMNVLLQRRDISVNRIGTTESPLCTAVNSDNRHAVQRLLQCQGININDGSLMRAIHMMSINTVDDLLEAGCDVNIRDEYRTSAVMEAAKLGSTEILDRLLQYREVDINAKDEKGRLSSYFETGGFPPTDTTMGLVSLSTFSGIRLFVPWCKVPHWEGAIWRGDLAIVLIFRFVLQYGISWISIFICFSLYCRSLLSAWRAGDQLWILGCQLWVGVILGGISGCQPSGHCAV
jgi:ankyrin repeat protein